ncbi:hypothetical protein FACS189425_01940 [Clostridia bacterium]|nr:hypothetical protein FACS189425_01940 [Clostridia bacterium]
MNRFRALREAHTLSMAKLAKIVGVTAGQIHKYESDENMPSSSVLAKYSEHFNVTADYMLELVLESNELVVSDNADIARYLAESSPKTISDKLRALIGCVDDIRELNMMLGMDVGSFSAPTRRDSDVQAKTLLAFARVFKISTDYLIGTIDAPVLDLRVNRPKIGAMLNPPPTTGERIRRLREGANISVRDLAATIGVAHSAITYHENGDNLPNSEAIIKYARFFNISADFLLGLTDEIRPLERTLSVGRVGKRLERK